MATRKKATARPLTVYQRGEHEAIVGPLGEYAVGDEVMIPARGPKLGDQGLAEFKGRVAQVAQDGAARVVVDRTVA